MSKGWLIIILEALCRKLVGCKCDAESRSNEKTDYWIAMFNRPEPPKDKILEVGLEKKMRKAFNLAHSIRRFEINLYWKRALYFWGFQAAIFVAFATLVAEGGLITGWPKEVSVVENGNSTTAKIFVIKENFDFFTPLIAFSGLIMAIAWFYVNKGSKAWQENWERHIVFLEYYFSGNLYATTLKGKESFYSVSKINVWVSGFVVLVWFGILLFIFSQNLCLENAFLFWEKCEQAIPIFNVLYPLALFITAFFILVCFCFNIFVNVKSGLKDENDIKVSKRKVNVSKCTCDGSNNA